MLWGECLPGGGRVWLWRFLPTPKTVDKGPRKQAWQHTHTHTHTHPPDPWRFSRLWRFDGFGRFWGGDTSLELGPDIPINKKTHTMGPEMITQMIWKQFWCVTDVCAIGKFIPRQPMCVIGTFTQSTLWRCRITQIIPARKPCPVQLEINSQIIKCVCVINHFGPYFVGKNKTKTIHPKFHGKIQIRIWELRGENPHCKDLGHRIWL